MSTAICNEMQATMLQPKRITPNAIHYAPAQKNYSLRCKI
jgi:hypothetical protein